MPPDLVPKAFLLIYLARLGRSSSTIVKTQVR